MRISTRYIAALLPLLLLSLSVPADESTDAAAAAKTPAGISGFDFAGEFRRYAAGEKPCAWRPMAKAPGRPVGKVTVDGKAISFRGEPTDRWTGIVFSPGPRKERPATTPGMKLRFTVRMTGKGQLL